MLRLGFVSHEVIAIATYAAFYIDRKPVLRQRMPTATRIVATRIVVDFTAPRPARAAGCSRSKPYVLSTAPVKIWKDTNWKVRG
jgi:hypothetical protein